MKQLHHNGVLIPDRYPGNGLTIEVKGNRIKLTPEQEEMALAWAKKIGTPYIEDSVFAKNFHHDFSKKIGIKIKPGEVDFSEILECVENERSWKANLSKEEKRNLASNRKVKRKANKELCGYAWVDGAQVEIANYVVEPSSIFMGRGKHPLRGRWKEGPCEQDVVLNLSPDAPRPLGNWKGIVWQPDDMWIARWKDKLTGKMKYVWFSESTTLKQRREIDKFDKARELRQNLSAVQKHLSENLDAVDIRRRKIATVCFLVDELKIRVGDEKDPDEADTVGASTLRQEHIYFNGDGTVTFNFFGKDFVRHVFRVELPRNVINNLKEFAANSKSTLFNGVGSKHVSEFLDEVMTGLSAKVFRTSYASEAVETMLQKADVKPENPEYYKRYTATLANLEAAKVCNHRRKMPKSWRQSLEKKRERLKVLQEQAKKAQAKLSQKAKELELRHIQRLNELEERLEAVNERLKAYEKQLIDRKKQDKPIYGLKKRIRVQRRTLARQKQRLRNTKTKYTEQMKSAKQKLKSRRQRSKAAIDKLKLKIKTQKETRNYNLATSLKSYIDPRIYYEWGKQVEYNWRKYYSKSLQKKFSWVEADKTP